MLKTVFNLILVVLPCFSEVSMGNPIDDYTDQKLIQFKHKIGYDKIISNLGADKKYVVDWIDVLSEFVDEEGIKWHADSEPHYYVSGTLGTVKTTLSDHHETVAVEIRKGGDRLRDTVDSMLRIAASGSAPRVGMKVMTDRCPGDFCLIFGDASAPSGIYMAKGNILAKIKCLDDCTVFPIAKHISEQMDRRNLDPRQSPISKISLQLKTDRDNVKQGEEFVFTVEPRKLFDDEDWLMDVRPANDEELKYVKEEPGRITYKTLRRGAAKITVDVMHKRTLQVKEEIFVVNVN